MKVLLSRCSKGKVNIKGRSVAEIDRGLALFVGIEEKDDKRILERMAEKIINLRIFPDHQGKFSYSLKSKNYFVMCVPNFTLCANTNRGRRPSFEAAMKPSGAESLFTDFVNLLKANNINVTQGVFGAEMKIDIEMDGPVNIMLSI